MCPGGEIGRRKGLKIAWFYSKLFVFSITVRHSSTAFATQRKDR